LTDEVQKRFSKARRLLRVARTYNASEDPEGVAHHAYYAMYHAATAVLLSRDGSYPKTHANLVGQFGLVVRDLDQAAKQHGRAFREAYELRLLADYDAGATNLTGRVQASLAAVSSFITFAEQMIARPTPTHPMSRKPS
jgi:uncharacterized protein (UPF0332 family)